MKGISNIYILILLMIPVFLWSCRQEDFTQQNDLYNQLIIYADIESGQEVTTRAERTNSDDMWSYVEFQPGDAIGFYASGGKFPVGPGENDAFVNYELIYSSSTRFEGPDGTPFNPSQMNGNETYIYFPYNPNMTFSPDNEAMAGTGIELRSLKEGTQSPERCIDYLSAKQLNMEGTVSGEPTAMYGVFEHTFAELIIMRGKGFDAPPAGKESITAVLNNPYTHIRVNYNDENGWSCYPELYYNINSSLSIDQARRWVAWQGENYGKTIENGVETEGRPAWYVIVPTLGVGNNGSIVDYIELYDNEGHLQRVSALKLHVVDHKKGYYTKNADSSTRYPMEITMEELVPTVNPFEIIPWNDNEDLTDRRERGINNEAEFAQWVYDYNAYLLDNTNEEKRNKLLKYGDLIINGDTGEYTFHFYVTSDLNFEFYTPLPSLDENGGEVSPDNTTIIRELKDVLDGKSSTLVNGKFINHTISGLTTTFIGSLSGGEIMNFDFIETNLDSESTEPLAFIAATIENGSVVNCNIDNGDLMNPNGPAGFIAGTMNGGTVRNCILSGYMIGLSTATSPADAMKIIGVNPTGTVIFISNNTADILMNTN